jgi:hypothetical protein
MFVVCIVAAYILHFVILLWRDLIYMKIRE